MQNNRTGFCVLQIIMDLLKWNPAVRGELMELIELHKSPFGTPAELECQTTTVVSVENKYVEETMWIACDMCDLWYHCKC